MNELIRRELERDQVSRKLIEDSEAWREVQELRVGKITPGMWKHYYRELLIDALVKLKRRGV